MSLRSRHSQVQIVVSSPIMLIFNPQNTFFYSFDALNASSLFTISACAIFLLLAYFRNNIFWSPSQMTMVESPSCASIFTRIGYLSTHFGVTVLDGKTCWTQETAVSRSCAPPSQLREYVTVKATGLLIFENSMGYYFV
mmetsp:Transcript_16645/g.34995  ORF Transcript_16645/g.34995 Transcript_16645/m.34995 type:complete len:139 (+) Transcript_16645:244-660(+)